MHVVAGHLRRSTTHAAHRTIAGSPATAAILANELDTVFVEISVSTRKIGLAKGIWSYAPALRALPGITGCWWRALRLRRHGPALLLKTLVQCLDCGQTPTGRHLDPQDPHASHSCALSGRSAVPDAACRIRSIRRSGGLPVQLGRSKGG